jgi:hypothetical protein
MLDAPVISGALPMAPSYMDLTVSPIEAMPIIDSHRRSNQQIYPVI